MIKTMGLFAGLLLLACVSTAPAQNTKTAERLSITQAFNRGVTGAENVAFFPCLISGFGVIIFAGRKPVFA